MENINNPENNPEQYLPMLTEEQDIAWQEICQGLETFGGAYPKEMIAMWADESLPDNIRDRALLSVVSSWEIIRMLGIRNRNNHPYTGSIESIKTMAPEFDENKLADWFRQKLEYEKLHKIELMEKNIKTHWGLTLFKHGIFTSEEVESVVSDWALSKPNNTDLQLEGIRLNRSAAILSNYFVEYTDYEGEVIAPNDDPVLRSWARDHLHSWIQNQADKSKPIADWVSVIKSDIGILIFRDMAKNAARGKYGISWDEVRPAIDLYGWDEILNPSYLFIAIDNMSSEQLDLKVEVLKWFINLYQRNGCQLVGRTDEKALKIIQEIAEQTNDQFLIEYVQATIEIHRLEKISIDNWIQQQSQNYREKLESSPDEHAKELSKSALEKAIASLRTAQ